MSTESLYRVAVAALIYNDKNQIILGARKNTRTACGLLSMPGGKNDQNEYSKTALARELQEECGMNVSESDMEEITWAERPDQRFVCLIYGIKSNDVPENVEKDKNESWDFYDIDFIEENISKTFLSKQVLDKIKSFLSEKSTKEKNGH